MLKKPNTFLLRENTPQKRDGGFRLPNIEEGINSRVGANAVSTTSGSNAGKGSLFSTPNSAYANSKGSKKCNAQMFYGGRPGVLQMIHEGKQKQTKTEDKREPTFIYSKRGPQKISINNVSTSFRSTHSNAPSRKSQNRSGQQRKNQ